MEKGCMVHHSQELAFRRPFGAVSVSEQVQLEVYILKEMEPQSLYLRLWQDGREPVRIRMCPYKENSAFVYYFASFFAPADPCLLWYDFEAQVQEGNYYFGNNSEGLGGRGEIALTPIPYQITVYKQEQVLPRWFREGIVYQIFVDRFFNGLEDGRILNPKKESLLHSHWDNTPIYIRDPKTNRVLRWDFFGGNLLGIQRKIPYLKDLGASILYLNPIFEAPSNHKYDTGNYHKIDPMFGDEKTLKELCGLAATHGMSIVLDGVFSHTGDDSLYFNKYGNYSSVGAYQSQQSPYFSWYRFKEYPEAYDCWWDIDSLPNVNELDPSYLEFIIFGENSVLRHWMKMGIKGWRLDVADELPGEFIQKLRQEMKKIDGEGILIGEVWEDASNKLSYGHRREYLLGRELDSVTNYPFRGAVIDFLLKFSTAMQIHQRFMSLYENYPLSSFYGAMNMLGSHDVPRILTVLSGGEGTSPEDALKRTRLAVLWQMTFPGVPCVYYGDEAGVKGELDPLNRRTYPWGKENQELLGWHKKVIAIRKSHPVFISGTWQSFSIGEEVYGYIRQITGEKDVFGDNKQDAWAIVLMNRDTDGKEIHLDLSLFFGEQPVGLQDLLQGGIQWFQQEASLHLDPLEGKILLKV